MRPAVRPNPWSGPRLPFRTCRLSAALLLTLSGASLRAETYHEWCQAHFSPAQIAAGLASPLRDLDADSCSNLLEYFAATDPFTLASRLELSPVPPPATNSIAFPMAPDREDVVYFLLVSDDLLTWSEDGLLLCSGHEVQWSLNGHSYVKLGVTRRIGSTLDSDQDGLDDFFEESLAASDPNDPFTHIGQILPGDDFDRDGIPNLDEESNGPRPMPGGSFAPPPLLDPAALACALAAFTPPAPNTLVVHTPLH